MIRHNDSVCTCVLVSIRFDEISMSRGGEGHGGVPQRKERSYDDKSAALAARGAGRTSYLLNRRWLFHNHSIYN